MVSKMCHLQFLDKTYLIKLDNPIALNLLKIKLIILQISINTQNTTHSLQHIINPSNQMLNHLILSLIQLQFQFQWLKMINRSISITIHNGVMKMMWPVFSTILTKIEMDIFSLMIFFPHIPC